MTPWANPPSADIRTARYYSEGYWGTEFLTDQLDRCALANPDHVLVYDGHVALSWGEAREQSIGLARSLRALGLGAGDRVAVQLPNWHEFVIVYFALARFGAVMVPIMPVYREHEVAHVIDHSEARAYVYTPRFRKADYRTIADNLEIQIPSLEFRIAVRAGSAPAHRELLLEDLVERGVDSSDPPTDFVPSPDSNHLIVFTSGTESKPKGCLHTWNTYSFTPRNQTTLYGFGPDDIELVASPISHTTGLAAGFLKPFMAGGSVCLMESWVVSEAVELLNKVGCTQMTGATPFLTMLLDEVAGRGPSVDSLRVFVCGGAPVPAEVVKRASSVLGGCRVLTNYGQSECLVLTTTNLRDDETRIATSDGKAQPGVDVKLIDPAGGDVTVGDEGEICYRSPGAMLRYWNNPEAMEAIELPGGWRRTGDLGRCDPDGYYRVTGRVKELIIRGGTNISMRELEELLMGHSTVRAVAVVGIPDPVLGERIGVAVVPADGARPELDELISYLRDDRKISIQKLPERLLVVKELPMTPTGKVLKSELVDPISRDGRVSAIQRARPSIER